MGNSGALNLTWFCSRHDALVNLGPSVSSKNDYFFVLFSSFETFVLHLRANLLLLHCSVPRRFKPCLHNRMEIYHGNSARLHVSLLPVSPTISPAMFAWVKLMKLYSAAKTMGGWERFEPHMPAWGNMFLFLWHCIFKYSQFHIPRQDWQKSFEWYLRQNSTSHFGSFKYFLLHPLPVFTFLLLFEFFEFISFICVCVTSDSGQPLNCLPSRPCRIPRLLGCLSSHLFVHRNLWNPQLPLHCNLHCVHVCVCVSVCMHVCAKTWRKGPRLCRACVLKHISTLVSTQRKRAGGAQFVPTIDWVIF